MATITNQQMRKALTTVINIAKANTISPIITEPVFSAKRDEQLKAIELVEHLLIEVKCSLCGLSDCMHPNDMDYHYVKYIIIFGDPVKGFNFRGPFDDFLDAQAHADDNEPNEVWYIAELNPPVSEQPKPPNEISEKTT